MRSCVRGASRPASSFSCSSTPASAAARSSASGGGRSRSPTRRDRGSGSRRRSPTAGRNPEVRVVGAHNRGKPAGRGRAVRAPRPDGIRPGRRARLLFADERNAFRRQPLHGDVPACTRKGWHRRVRPFHGLRHSSITNGAAAGMSAASLQKRAGHSAFSTTQANIDLAGVESRRRTRSSPSGSGERPVRKGGTKSRRSRSRSLRLKLRFVSTERPRS